MNTCKILLEGLLQIRLQAIVHVGLGWYKAYICCVYISNGLIIEELLTVDITY